MTADERLALIRAKIERAKEHIRDLHIEVRAFISTPPEPYAVSTKRDPQTRELIYYVSSAAEHVPVRISSIVGDVVQNIRSGLDHLAYQLVSVGCPGVEPGRQVYFPISESADKYKIEAPGKVKGMRQDAIEAINALKPYKGGNDLLWQIHKLNNIDKHRMLIAVGAAHVAHSLTPHIRETLRAAVNHSRLYPALWDERITHISLDARQIKCPLKEGDELFRDVPDAEMDKDMQLYVEIVFGEPQILYPTMLAPTLMRMATYVDDLILSFKPFLA